MGTLLIDDPAPTDDMLSFERVSSGWATGAAWDQAWATNPATAAYVHPIEMSNANPDTAPDLPIQSLMRITGVAPTRLSPDQAEEKYGIPGQLTFKDYPNGISDSAASLLHGWKQDEIRRSDILARATPGFVPGAARFAAGAAASVLDPVNVASAFIPVLGEARFAALAGKIGLTGARVARGALEGAVGQAAIEPLILLQARTEQSDYDAYDSLLNITFGALIGAGLHVGGGFVKDRIVGRPDLRIEAPAPRISAEAHDTALRGAVAAVAEDRPVMVAGAVRLASRRDALMGGAAIPAEVRLPDPVRFVPPDGLAETGARLADVDAKIARMEAAGQQTTKTDRLVDLYRERKDLLETARKSVPQDTWADAVRVALYEPSKDPAIQKARVEIATIENKIQAMEDAGKQASGGERLTDLRRSRVAMLEEAERLLPAKRLETLARTTLADSVGDKPPVTGLVDDSVPPPADVTDQLDQQFAPPRVDTSQTFDQAWESIRQQQRVSSPVRPSDTAALAQVDARVKDVTKPATVETESKTLEEWATNDSELVDQQRAAGNLDATDEALLKEGAVTEKQHLGRAKAMEALAQCLI